MEKPMNERIVKVETQLENHEKRLNKHGEEIDELKINTIRQDSEIAQLRAELKKNPDDALDFLEEKENNDVS